MRVDGGVAAVDEEAKLAKSAAVADELVDVGVCHRRTGALERKVGKMSAERVLDSVRKGFDSLIILEVYGIVRAHFFGYGKSLFFAIHSNDAFDAHGTKHGYADKADRAATLNHHARIEAQNAGGLSAFDRMDKHCARFDKDSRIKVEVADIENGRTALDDEIIGEPDLDLNILQN